MTDMEKRIEAAAMVVPGPGAGHPWHEKAARRVLEAAFPELFTDPPTMWLAPFEPSEAMIEAAVPQDWIGHPEAPLESIERWRAAHRRSALTGFTTMRDAHLSSAPEEGGQK